VDPPSEVSALGPSACIAEQLIGGRLCTIEGYVHRGHLQVYGVVDSIRAPNRSTFSRYQYPSRLPRDVQHRMAHVAARVVGSAGFDNGPFNIEMFYDRGEDRLWLLEVNCRISQSHGRLFAAVDGVSHHQVMVDLALGREPRIVAGGGEHACAAKYFLRHWSDATVVSVPDPEEIAHIERAVPGTSIHLEVQPGDRLSRLPDQDSYSYELGHVYAGASDERELRTKLDACEELLAIDLVGEEPP
jgi:biotin carboxylase